MKVRLGGNWRPSQQRLVRVRGEWKSSPKAYIKDRGVWRLWVTEKTNPGSDKGNKNGHYK